MIQIYSVPGTSATAVSCALEESGLPYTTVQVERRNRDNPSAFKTVNPLGRVPALDNEGEHVFETGAELLYLVDLAADNTIGPKAGQADRGQLLSWLFYLSNTLHPTYYGFYGPQWVTTSGDGHEGIKEYAVKKLCEHYDFVNTQLEGKTFLLGDQFSVADLYLHMLVSLSWTMELDAEVQKRPNLAKHWATVNARPAVTKALAVHASDKQQEQAGTLKIG